MQVDGKTLTIPKTLWVQHGGVDAAERGPSLVLTGRDEDSYVKVLNHFGRVLKLLTFEGGRWIDTDTGMEIRAFDEAQAGRLPAPVAGAKRPAVKPVRAAAAKGAQAAKPAASPKSKPAAKPAARKAPKSAPKKASAAGKPAARKAPANPRATRRGA